MTTFNTAYLLKEDGCYLLLESGGRIILEQSILHSEYVGDVRFISTSLNADFSSDSAMTSVKGIT